MARPDDALDAALTAYQEGRLVEARRWFLLAHEQEPSARTLRGLGVVSFALGEYVEAIAYLEASLRHPVRPLTDDLRERVTRLVEEAKRHVGRIQVESTVDRTDVHADGRPVILDDGHGFYVPPGSHRLVVRADGQEVVDTERHVAAGAVETVTVEPPAALSPTSTEATLAVVVPEPADALARADRSPPVPVHPPRTRARASIAIAVGGAGLLASGATLYFVARHRHEDIAQQCRSGCTADRVAALYDADHVMPLKRAGEALTAIGLAATVTGVVLRYTHPRETRGADVVLVGPSTVSWARTF